MYASITYDIASCDTTLSSSETQSVQYQGDLVTRQVFVDNIVVIEDQIKVVIVDCLQLTESDLTFDQPFV